jgi:hypothetical protein
VTEDYGLDFRGIEGKGLTVPLVPFAPTLDHPTVQ